MTWNPTQDTPSTSQDISALAERIVSDLSEANLATLWEALPWSWLIDWFSSVGSYLDANRNLVAAVGSPVQLMDETTSHFRIAGHTWYTGTDDEIELSPIDNVCITKSRDTRIPGVSAHLPWLNAGQMSILGSIAATRVIKP
jgi:hypothetical protein